jgi:uncharacterized metal-binding protein/predicted Fe-Mo cluster-binding NifX family protein
MVVGVPLLNDRVAPRCTSADHLMVVTLRRERVVSQYEVPIEIRSPFVLLDVLQGHGVETLVCGGISREAREALQSQAIAVVDNVASSATEVAAALDAGSLCPGFGLGAPVRARQGSRNGDDAAGARAVSTPTLALPDCLACADRVCLRGETCRVARIGDGGAAAGAEVQRMLSASADVACESERQLCRLSELVYFCLEMEYSRVGVAFCVELLEPAEILTRVLRRFFTVVPVCCMVGGSRPPDAGAHHAPFSMCDPRLQARVLNETGTDINVIVGLCIGADCIFTAASDAPVTTLFVKDRSLANNPIGAVYSEYHIRESTAPRGVRGTRNGSSHRDGLASPSSRAPRPREAP